MKVWEGKLMRRKYGGLREGEEWTKQINQETLYKDRDYDGWDTSPNYQIKEY
jgi:hypothetical protein